MKVVKLNRTNVELVREFCVSAGKAGYTNNESLEKMKFGGQYDLHGVPNYWAVEVNNTIISVSGSHLLLDYSHPGVSLNRCLFRSATLPEYQNIVPGISKTHMNSLPFSVLLPHQIKAGIKSGYTVHIVTTSNGDHDASGKMKRTHRALELLAKQNIVEEFDQLVFYHTPQTLWKINLEVYHRALVNFHPTRIAIGIEPDQEYMDIINNGF